MRLMCCFITYIVPALVTLEEMQLAFSSEKIRLRPYSPSMILPELKTDEQCWIRANGCDCANPIGNALWEQTDGIDPVEAARKKYARKGWSAAKIERAVSDLKQRETSQQITENPIGRIVPRLFANTDMQTMRLFHHEYSGNVDLEKFAITGKTTCNLHQLSPALEALAENTMLHISRR